MRRDRTELVTRAVQPTLWLVVFGTTFTRLGAIPTGDVPYLDFLAPGVIAQSALFISIFYGIQIIWDRDAGVLAKLMTTPTPRAALALYPVALMPGWLQAVNHVNPLSYQVEALRGLLIGTPARYWLDFAVLIGSAAVGICVAAGLLGRLAK